MTAKEIQNLVSQVAEKIDAHSEVLRSAPDFHRFLLTRDGEREMIDIVTDRAPQLDPEKNLIDGIRVDTQREILANKLTTLLSRSEAEDIIDLYFLEQAGHDILSDVSDAYEKDGGWEPATVAMLLENIDLETAPALLIKELTSQDLEAFLQRLRLAIVKLALPDF